MAPRAFLLCVCFTIGLLSSCSPGVHSLDIGLGFDTEPSDVTVVRSKAVTLACVARSSLGPVRVTWTHNGRPLKLGVATLPATAAAATAAAAVNASRRVLNADGSLHIRKVVTKRVGPDDGPDQGEYRCVASAAVVGVGAAVTNPVALVSRPARLRVAALSHDFTESPADQTVEEGSTIRFACQIESVPDVVTVWEKDNKPILTNSRYIFIASGVLFISTAEKGDAGSYRCVVTNPLTRKQRTSTGGQLTVLTRTTSSSPPIFLTKATSLQVNIGDNLTLECAANGWPPPKIAWLHKSQVPNRTESAAGVDILYVSDVTAGHEGNYTCRAGSANVTQTFSVAVLAPPTFVKQPLSQVYPTAKTVRFDCEVQGTPTPEVVWFKDGLPLQINGRIKQRPSELLLSSTLTDDSGLYQCVAKNAAGEAWVAGRLLVNSSRYQPEPPHGLACHAKSASVVEVTWQHADSKLSENLIKAYTVHYIPSAGGEERQGVSVNKSAIIEKLAAFTNYTFYVRAYSGRSASDQSQRVVCQTGEGVPQWVPSLTLEPTSPTTLRVGWTPLSNEKARGLVVEYKIQWRREGSPSSNVDQMKGDVLEYTITALHPGKRYEVRVLAATSEGWPDVPDDHLRWSAVDMPAHDAGAPRTAPVVHLTVVNFTAIDVTWTLPADAAYKPAGYKLFYRRQNGQETGPLFFGPNVTQFLLADLEPDELYEVYVAGWTGKTDGDRGFKSIHTLAYASSITSTPLLDHLDAPTSLYAEPTSPTSINLTWVPPTRSANITYYTVWFGLVSNPATPSFVSSTSNGVEMSNLAPYALYEFKVRSHDLVSHGAYSQTVECRTQEDVPGPVREVQWKALNSTTARVSWKAPETSNGVISAYLVSYSSDATLPAERWRSQRVPTPRTNTDLVEMAANTRYLVSVRAETGAGLGPAASELTLLIIPSVSRATAAPPVASEEPDSDQHLGIMVGMAIGVFCVVLCVVAILWRRRCAESAFPDGGGGGGARNGNGCCRERHAAASLGGSDLHELQLLSDTSAQMQQAVHSQAPHANLMHGEKGGGCYPNGQANGASNGRISNGHAVRPRSNVHITENPQYHQKCLASSTPVGSSRSIARGEHTLPLLPIGMLGQSDDGMGDSFQAIDEQRENSKPADWTRLTSLDETPVASTGNDISNITPTSSLLPQQT